MKLEDCVLSHLLAVYVVSIYLILIYVGIIMPSGWLMLQLQLTRQYYHLHMTHN